MVAGETSVVELQHVTVAFGGDVILSDVSLRVNSREVAVIVGISGSGKSVLLRTIAGVLHPTEGRVLVFGRAWTEMTHDEHHETALKIGMQFQKSALFDEMTAAENIEFVLKEQTNMKPLERRERSRVCLRSVGLEKAAALKPFEMSGGMRQRVGIARALALDPQLLIIDDPTAGLDPVNADVMVDMIVRLNKNLGSTLVVVTHDIRRAYQFGGSLYLLANQSLLKIGSPQDAERSSDPRVVQFVNGQVHGPLTDQTQAI